MNKKKKRTIATLTATSLAVALTVLGFLSYWQWWRPGADQSACRLQIQNYNAAIRSCAIEEEAIEAWKTPETTEALALKLFGEQIPTCPAGGVYTITYDPDTIPHPVLVCSLGEKCGHVD